MSSIQSSGLAKLQSGLDDFLMEYCIYATTLSMVSLDPRLSTSISIGEAVEARGRALAEAHYVGTLCGCWIELLLMIPRITAFRVEVATADGVVATTTTSEHFAHFAILQSQLLTWTPSPDVSADQKYSGLFYQQALLLYLYTAVIGLDEPMGAFSSDLIASTLAKALLFLESVPPTAQVNTLLGWPIAIVGSCLTIDEQKIRIRDRLSTMLNTIGLGNIREILGVLEITWESGLEEANPWNFYKVMEEHHMSFSFA